MKDGYVCEKEPQPGLSAHGRLDATEQWLRGDHGGGQPADECRS